MSLEPAEVSRIVDEGLAQGHEFGWLERLSIEQLVAECEKRGLPTGGIVPTLRARIKKYERGVAEIRENISSESDRPAPQLRNGGSADRLPPSPYITPVSRGENRSASRVPMWPRPEAMPANEAMGEPTPWRGAAVATGAIPREPRHRGTGPGRGINAPPTLTPLEIAKWMRQWEITYNGTRGADADGFIRKVRRLRAVVPVADKDLFVCLPFYLKGVALSWFEEKQARLTTWDQFEESFRQRFALQGSRALLSEEVRKRTQGEAEPVADYFACLYALFRQLDPPWTEAEKLDRSHQNLLPRIQMWIPRRQVRDMDELERLAIYVEEDLHLAGQYRAPPTPDRVVCPEWAYHPPRRTTRSHAAVGIKEEPPSAPEHQEGEDDRAVLYQTRDARRDAAVQRRGCPSPPPIRNRPRPPETVESHRTSRTAREDSSRIPSSRQPEDQPFRRRWSPPPRQRQLEPRRGNLATPANRGRPAPQGRAEGITCWRCGIPGHYARDCPDPPTKRGQAPAGKHETCCGHQCAGNANRRE